MLDQDLFFLNIFTPPSTQTRIQKQVKTCRLSFPHLPQPSTACAVHRSIEPIPRHRVQLQIGSETKARTENLSRKRTDHWQVFPADVVC